MHQTFSQRDVGVTSEAETSSVYIYRHDVTVFKDFRIRCLHGNDNGGIFENLVFETCFQKYAFSVPCCRENERAKRITSSPFLAENVV